MPVKKYSLYQPRITDENIRRLYQMKERVGLPMTHLLNEIIESFFANLALEELEPLPVDAGEGNQLDEIDTPFS